MPGLYKHLRPVTCYYASVQAIALHMRWPFPRTLFVPRTPSSPTHACDHTSRVLKCLVYIKPKTCYLLAVVLATPRHAEAPPW